MPIPTTAEEEVFFSTLTQRGEAAVRSDLETAHFGGRAALARKWLHLLDQERAEARDAQAARSIEIAERAAEASSKAARWTFWAAIAAAVSALASLLQVILPHSPK